MATQLRAAPADDTSVDPQNGRSWSSDSGQNAIDEFAIGQAVEIVSWMRPDTAAETESQNILRNLAAARRQHAATSREAAQQILTANLVQPLQPFVSAVDSYDHQVSFLPIRHGLFTMQAKAKHTALSRQQHQGPSSGFSSPRAPGKESLPVHNTMLGVSRTILASEMPAVEPLPPYKAWHYLVSNELAQGVGRQMYYTDEIGIYYTH